MNNCAVGIHDIAVYIPENKITLEKLVQHRSNESPELAPKLERAVATTGQKALRFPSLYQDNSVLAAQAAHTLLQQNTDYSAENLRYLTVGTETSVDHSKPIAAYVQGMLKNSGLDIPNSLSTFQVQHACAGGTAAMLSVAGMLQAAGRDSESGLVISSDIARYQASTTAEITQGAGAAAMLLSRNPALLELDLASAGYNSNDVDDFFRPLGSITAKVKGSYSVQCYHDAFTAALKDHADRLGSSPAEVLKNTDIFALHVPFRNMAYNALMQAVQTYLGFSEAEAESFLTKRGFTQALETPAQTGNIYSGSLYMTLAYSLQERHQHFGDQICGKRTLIISYGSGNTMLIVGGKVAQDAPAVIDSWKLPELHSTQADDLESYLEWMASPLAPQEYNARVQSMKIPAGNFALSRIREDGYREYSFASH